MYKKISKMLKPRVFPRGFYFSCYICFMRYLLVFSIIFFSGNQLLAQNNLGQLLASGIEDTRTFAKDYIRPGTEASIFNLSNGWYQTAEVKEVLEFEFSIIGNASVNLDKHHTFFLNTVDYQNIEFADGAVEKEVATIFGTNPTPVEVLVSYDTPFGTEQESITLPQGLAASGVEMLPTAFVQARLGIFKGTEIKARYFPKINYENVEAVIYGGAIQHEFTSWMPSLDFPVAVSGIVGFTKMQGAYDFTELSYLEGANQQLNAEINSWLFSAIASTKLPVINFYGGVGYVAGSSTTDMLGTYKVVDDSGDTIAEVEDPFSITDKIDGIKANLGMSLQLGFLKLHADYNFQEYEAISLGLHFGI